MKVMAYVLLNQKIFPKSEASVSIYDRGLTLGVGFFETMKWQDGEVKNFSYHFARIKASASLLKIELPFYDTELLIMIQSLAKKNGMLERILCVRLTITEGEAERGILPPADITPNFFIILCPLPKFNEALSAAIVDTMRNENNVSSQIKTTSYIDNVLAKKEAAAMGVDEALIKNSQGNIAEGATSNIFIVNQDNSIITPPISEGALPGTMRAKILNEASNKFNIKEDIITIKSVEQAREIFITNALMGIKPIEKIKSIFSNDDFYYTEKIKQRLNL